ncbi:MAG: outer membrane lipoprotein carrier protein LolA [Acidobacteriota bacterium]
MARNRDLPRLRRLLLQASCLLLLGFGCLAHGDQLPDPEDPSLEAGERVRALLERIRIEQAQLETLSASFTQRKEGKLLLEPEVSTGNFWYRAPDRVRWDFDEPDRTRIVVNEGQMVTWHLDLKKAEVLEVGNKADRVMQLLSASNSVGTLQRYFDVTAAFPGNVEAPYRLDLDPRSRRLKKRIRSMTIHLHRTGFYPVYIEYVEPDGDTTELTFTDSEKNSALEDSIFTVDLPAEVEVSTVELGS